MINDPLDTPENWAAVTRTKLTCGDTVLRHRVVYRITGFGPYYLWATHITGHGPNSNPPADEAIRRLVGWTEPLVDWARIATLAGPNNLWPGRPVYLYSSLASVEDPETRLPSIRAEAESIGWESIPHGAHLYLVGPDNNPQG